MVQNQAINSLRSLIAQIPHRNGSVECYGASGSERAYFIWRIYRELRIPIFVVAPSTKLAQSILEDLRFFKDAAEVPLFLFPSYNILPFKFLAYHNETAARRISALYQLLEYKTPPIVVSSVGALLQKIIPKQEIINYTELIVAGEEIEREDLIEKLVSGGYVHASIVEEPGDFCVRGGSSIFIARCTKILFESSFLVIRRSLSDASQLPASEPFKLLTKPLCYRPGRWF
jgi:transcription-repair coupling factor (superfamily II helicase)